MRGGLVNLSYDEWRIYYGYIMDNEKTRKWYIDWLKEQYI